MITDSKYYAIDKKFLDVPYLLGGKTLNGTDCIGIAILYLKEHGINYEYEDGKGPIYKHWYFTAPSRLRSAVLEYGNFVRFYELKKFDIVLFFGSDQTERFPTMGGIMIDDRHFLTLAEERGSLVHILSLTWKDRFWGAIRLHEVVNKGL